MAGIELLGGAGAAIGLLAGGTTGTRLAAGLVSAGAAILVGLVTWALWRSADDLVPPLVVHLPLVGAGAALLVGADRVAGTDQTVALLATGSALVALVSAMSPIAGGLTFTAAMVAGMGVVAADRHADPALVVPVLGTLAGAASVAAGVTGALLRRSTLVDPLTGLPNRAALELIVDNQIAVARRTGRPLSLVLVNLDDFTAVNDVQGRMEGDRVLRDVAAAWSVVLRRTDVLARYGGDEFVLVLPNCGPDGVPGVVQRMLAATAQRGTAGATGFVEGDTFASMVRRAERTMREAKTIERGQVVVRMGGE